MKYLPLGSTGITVSLLGFGTGTADDLGRCRQAMMDERRFIALLRFAHERGITHWDTAMTYKTHHRLRKALQDIKRDQIVLTTKLTSTTATEARHDLERALDELGTDYVDVCLIHAVRNRHDFGARVGVLDELIKSRHEGKIRAVGLSSHGMGALELALEVPEIEVVWARINYAGLLMDTRKLGLYDTLASWPSLKKIFNALPKGIIAPIRKADTLPVSARDRQEIGRLLHELRDLGKGIVGMKVFAEGRLSHDSLKALDFVNRLPYLDGYVVGMLTEEEIEESCRLLES